MPLKGEFGILQIFSATATFFSLDASLAIPTRVLRFEASQRKRLGRSNRPSWVVEPAWVATPPRRVFDLGFVAQPSNPVVFW
jgi:hypothetical protein